jgi:hypothetical protein
MSVDAESDDVEKGTADQRHCIGWGPIGAIEQPVKRQTANHVDGVHGIVDLDPPGERNGIGRARYLRSDKNPTGNTVKALVRDH